MKSKKPIDLKQQTARRLKIIKGQITGLIKLIENDEYCVDILNQ
ncbi:MAG: metal-sensitive transcriptional regulator, partial [bacterium]|nr:metal-sensitive transcriptional regulator [bacterium]